MFIQEIACPNCNELTRVNVYTSTDEDAWTSYSKTAKCRHCRTTITYDVDVRGKNAEISDIWIEDADELGE